MSVAYKQRDMKSKANIKSTIERAAASSSRSEHYTIMRCWLSDGTVQDMDLMRAFTFNNGELVDNEVIYPDVHIVRTECISGAEYVSDQLLCVVLQMINGIEDNEK